MDEAAEGPAELIPAFAPYVRIYTQSTEDGDLSRRFDEVIRELDAGVSDDDRVMAVVDEICEWADSPASTITDYHLHKCLGLRIILRQMYGVARPPNTRAPCSHS